MTLTLTNETIIYPALFDDINETQGFEQARMGSGGYIKGDDGKSYFLDRTFNVFEVDLETGERTLTRTYSEATIQAAVTAKSGLATPGASSCWIKGILHPTNYVLVAENGLGGGFPGPGTNFSIWKINGSGDFVCEAAIHYVHPSALDQWMYHVSAAGITNNKTEDDPIVVVYGGNSSGTQRYHRAWRLPSINQFYARNGSSYSNTILNYNCITAVPAGTSQLWGGRTTAEDGGITKRRADIYFWMLPYQGGTRLYFYNGYSDTNNSETTNWSNIAKATYGNEFFAYIDLGVVEYSDTGQWVQDWTPTVDNSLLKSTDNTSNLLPLIAYDGDGTTPSSGGLGDYGPGAHVQKLSTGQWLVTMTSFVDNGVGVSPVYDPYVGAAKNFIGRWLSFIYDPSTGKHKLVSKGSYTPCTRETFYASGLVPNFSAYAHRLHYAEETQKMHFYLCTDRLTGGLTLDGIGVIDRDITFDFTGQPAFINETDTTYKDFVARYP